MRVDRKVQDEAWWWQKLQVRFYLGFLSTELTLDRHRVIVET